MRNGTQISHPVSDWGSSVLKAAKEGPGSNRNAPKQEMAACRLKLGLVRKG